MRLKVKYTLSGIKQASNGTFCRKEAHFRLIFQVALKRSVIAAKGIEDHFSAETEANNERIKTTFAHQFSVSVAEVKEQRLVFAMQSLGQLFFQLVDVF